MIVTDCPRTEGIGFDITVVKLDVAVNVTGFPSIEEFKFKVIGVVVLKIFELGRASAGRDVLSDTKIILNTMMNKNPNDQIFLNIF